MALPLRWRRPLSFRMGVLLAALQELVQLDDLGGYEHRAGFSG